MAESSSIPTEIAGYALWQSSGGIGKWVKHSGPVRVQHIPESYVGGVSYLLVQSQHRVIEKQDLLAFRIQISRAGKKLCFLVKEGSERRKFLLIFRTEEVTSMFCADISRYVKCKTVNSTPATSTLAANDLTMDGFTQFAGNMLYESQQPQQQQQPLQLPTLTQATQRTQQTTQDSSPVVITTLPSHVPMQVSVDSTAYQSIPLTTAPTATASTQQSSLLTGVAQMHALSDDDLWAMITSILQEPGFRDECVRAESILTARMPWLRRSGQNVPVHGE
eukprot:TRINITY_DN10114_c0_g1_i1.p1 TRINITY_DN10114_c0_g1~~TRINITY_DN10114_c0_g1_i1.p1  ORF type:complete len:277 (-),score=43.37 TRINITY_DN10114_c0_g1_i1:18-848(-)